MPQPLCRPVSSLGHSDSAHSANRTLGPSTHIQNSTTGVSFWQASFPNSDTNMEHRRQLYLLIGSKNHAKEMKDGEVTQLGLLHRARPRQSAAAVTPQWTLHDGRLRHPCVRHAKGGGCYPKDAARASATRTTRQRKVRTKTSRRRLSIQSLSEERGKQGPVVNQLLASGWHECQSIRARLLPPTAALTHWRAHMQPAHGPRRPPPRQAASPAGAPSPLHTHPAPRPHSEPPWEPPGYPFH